MAIIEAEFATALKGRVKTKRNATGKFRPVRSNRAKASGAAAGAPEVMVKITGYGKGGDHLAAHLGYTSRNSQLELETDKGEILKGKDDIRAFVADWKADFGDRRGRKNQRDTMHAVFSMPPGTPSEAVRVAVRNFTKAEFGSNHEYAFVLHSPENDSKTKQPHCHVAVKCRGIDGRRLSTNPQDVQRWREGFAAAMRSEGVDCEATPRVSRGVVQKPVKQAQMQMAARGAPGNYVAQARQQAAQAAAAQATGKRVPPAPWELPIAKGQARVRAAWLNAASALADNANRREEFANRKVTINERPNYDTKRPTNVRTADLALQQSRAASVRGEIPSSALAGLRDVSALDVVHDSNGPEMLLQANARGRLGSEQRAGDANHGLRRERDSHRGPAGRGEQLTHPVATPEADRALAGRIRAFVGAMPSIHTRHQAEVAAQLAQAVRQSAGAQPGRSTPAPSSPQQEPRDPHAEPER